MQVTLSQFLTVTIAAERLPHPVDDDRRLVQWAGVVLGLHALLLALALISVDPRKIDEPLEQAIPVEVVSAEPTQMARGDVAAPRPAPDAVPTPSTDQPPLPNQQVTTPSPPPLLP